jgi:hypothetical protein
MAQSKPDLTSALQLCLGVLPVWIRQLASSRTQSDAAVHGMLAAFAEMDPGLRQVKNYAAGSNKGELHPPSSRSDLSQSLCDFLSPHLKVPAESASVIASVMQLIGNARPLSDVASVTTPHVRDRAEDLPDTAVDRMYQGLQYQDRIAQMMALLEEDMENLRKVIADQSAAVPGLDEWLARLESRYAMAEQRTSHSVDGSGTGCAASDETTFF